MSWLEHPTTTMPVVEFVSLAGWAVFATALAGWRQRQCWRWHYGVADAEPVRWEERPAEGAGERESARS